MQQHHIHITKTAFKMWFGFRRNRTGIQKKRAVLILTPAVLPAQMLFLHWQMIQLHRLDGIAVMPISCFLEYVASFHEVYSIFAVRFNSTFYTVG